MTDKNEHESFDVNKAKYNETTPLLDSELHKENEESIFAENEDRFHNDTKYSDTITINDDKKESYSKLVRQLQNHSKLNFLAPFAMTVEKFFKLIMGYFRFGPLFFAKKTHNQIINWVLFLSFFGVATSLFFNHWLIAIPIFFVGMDIIYWWTSEKFGKSKKDKNYSYILNKHKGFLSLNASIIILGLYTILGNSDTTFEQRDYFMQMLCLLTLIYVALSLYWITRKHFISTALCFITFYSISSQNIFVVNWNKDWNNEYTHINQTSLLAYTYYTTSITKRESAIEEITPYSFSKMETRTPHGVNMLYLDTVYTYTLSNSALSTIKNGKCLTTQFKFCPQDLAMAPKFIKNKTTGEYISSIADYNTYLKHQLNTAQNYFMRNLDIKITLPFKSRDYESDIQVLYNDFLQRGNEKYLSAKDSLKLKDLNMKVYSLWYGESVFDDGRTNARLRINN